MSATMEAMREEAVSRLEKLTAEGLHPAVLRDFREGRVQYSERARVVGPCGILYWIDNDTAKSRGGRPFAEVVREFEEEFDAVVYHATHELFEFGEVLDLFYVSDSDEEWEMDNDDLAAGAAFVRAVNLDDGLMSDFGRISFQIAGGGVVRTS